MTTPTNLPADPEQQNDARAKWAQRALDAFQRDTGTDDSDAIADLLCDLMHLCDRNGTCFDVELDRARMYYRDETEEW